MGKGDGEWGMGKGGGFDPTWEWWWWYGAENGGGGWAMYSQQILGYGKEERIVRLFIAISQILSF
jgi:hypothetical protein